MLKRLITIFAAVLLFLNMALIFYNSSLDSISSGKISQSIVESIVLGSERNGDVDADADESTENQAQTAPDKQTMSRYNYRLRNIFHLFEFACLGALVCVLFLLNSKMGMRICLFLSFVLGSCYAMSDEIHQIFVEGRAFEISDLLLDFSGVFAGVLAGCCLYVALLNKVCEKKI